MPNLRPFFSLITLILAAVAMVACGTSSTTQNRMLQSITVTPPTADANGSPVQFTATGNYTAPPVHVTPQPSLWAACYQNAPTSEVSVSQSGVAQCAGGAVGTYTVLASVQTQCNVVTACGGGCQITGTAQLTCP